MLRAIGTFGRSIKAMRLPQDIGDADPGDGVEPIALMPDLHALPGIWTPIKGYDKLLERLRSLGYRDIDKRSDAPPGNLLPLPYDWRLSNRRTAAWIKPIVEVALERWRAHGPQFADARLVFVCHSMGGLVARWYIERCGGAEITRKLITLGTPYRGAAKALEQLVNGVSRGIGPLSINLTEFARSLPSLHQLLPEYACVEHKGDLAKTTEIDIPELNRKNVADAMRFHAELRESEAKRQESLEATHAILGINQSTTTTAHITGSRVVPKDNYQADNLFGDATVPIVGACRADVAMTSNTLRRVPDKHGNLQRNPAALDELEGILTAKDIQIRARDYVNLRVDTPELVLSNETIPIQVTPAENLTYALRVAIHSETGQLVESRVLKPTQGPRSTTIDPLIPGAYTIDVTRVDPSAAIAPVSSDIIIWPQDATLNSL
ncbi:MAG: esterase/lipase family protein [Solirubrobacteraceae bacterium]